MARLPNTRLFWALGGLVACSGVSNAPHREQPILVEEGEFEHGALASLSGSEATVTSLSFSLGSVRAGARGVPLSGRVSAEAYSVAVALDEQGSGYWVQQVGSEDASFPGELTFDLLLDIGYGVQPGLAKLRVAPIDGDGKVGEPELLDLCVLPEIPDNGNACDPSVAPPKSVVSLSWDSDADLDLTLISPSGVIYNRSRRGVAGSDGKPLASFDRDSNSGCLLDNKRIENFVFNEVPEPGAWRVYVNLFDACGASSARFEVTRFARHRTSDGGFTLSNEERVRGTLLRSQADGGGGSPLYVTSFAL
jgi:hypothetical protein